MAEPVYSAEYRHSWALVMGVDDRLAPSGEHSLFAYHLLDWLTSEHVQPPGGIWRARELGDYSGKFRLMVTSHSSAYTNQQRPGVISARITSLVDRTHPRSRHRFTVAP
jgi:hypothetical protein